MVAKHERTLKMMENFMDLHNNGHSIGEIAKLYNLSVTTVYKSLDRIAKKNGVTRESLLEKPFEADHSGRNFTPVKPINRTKLQSSIATLRKGVKALREEVKNTIEDIETLNQVMEEEMK